MEFVKVFGLVIGINAVVWALILTGFKRTAASLTKSINEESVASGEQFIMPPANGYYGGGTKPFTFVRSMGVIALTNQRLIFRGPLRMKLDIPLESIAGTSENLWFYGHYRNGRQFLIIKLKNGSEAGFQVKDHQQWVAAISSHISA